MSTPNIIMAGSKGVIEGQIASTISRINGNSFRRTWRGLYDSLKLKQAWAATQPGWTEVTLEPTNDGVTGLLSATYTGPAVGGTIEIPVETLDLDFQEISGSIFKNPTFVSLDGEKIKAIERVIAVARDPNSKPGSVADKKVEEDIIPGSRSEAAIDLKMTGVDEYTWRVPVLTYTRTVSPQFPTPMVIADVGTVWSSGDVANYLEAKAVLFAIPQVSNNIGAPTGFTLGWMKDAKLSFISNGNCQLVEKFIYSAFSDHLYDTGNAPPFMLEG